MVRIIGTCLSYVCFLFVQASWSAAVPLKLDSNDLDIVFEAKAHVDLGPNGNSATDQTDISCPDVEAIQRMAKQQAQPNYITLTIPAPTQAPMPSATTRYPEPGCENCFGTIFSFEPARTAYRYVVGTGSGPYPTVSTAAPNCGSCDAVVHIYEPHQPKGGFPCPAATTVIMDGSESLGEPVTFPPVLPLDPKTVVYGGTPGFQNRLPTYTARWANSDSQTRTVIGHDFHDHKIPLVIVGDPSLDSRVSQENRVAQSQKAQQAQQAQQDGIQRNRQDTHITLPPFAPGGKPIVINIDAGNNNGNNENKVNAGNGLSSNSGSNTLSNGGNSLNATSSSGGNSLKSSNRSGDSSSKSNGSLKGGNIDSTIKGGNTDGTNTNDGGNTDGTNTNDGGNTDGTNTNDGGNTDGTNTNDGGNTDGTNTNDGGNTDGMIQGGNTDGSIEGGNTSADSNSSGNSVNGSANAGAIAGWPFPFPLPPHNGTHNGTHPYNPVPWIPWWPWPYPTPPPPPPPPRDS